MPLVRFTGNDTGAAELPAAVSWRLPAGREAGQVDVTIPRSHPLFAVDCWNTRADFRVDVLNPDLGYWSGFAQTVEVDADGARITALDLVGFAAARSVVTPRSFRYATAGVVAKAAVSDALTGLAAAGFPLGRFADIPPVLPAYALGDSVRSLGEVLADLGERSGQEWNVDPATGTVRWGPPKGVNRPGWLVEPGDIRDVRRSADASSVATEVVAVGPNGRDPVRAVSGRKTVWPAVVSVDAGSDDLTAKKLAAETELARRRDPVVTYTFILRPGLWASVREGDRVKLLVPSAGTAGECAVCRVLGRDWDGRDLTVTARRVQPVAMPRLVGDAVQRPVVVPSERDYLRRLADVRARVAALEAVQ